MDYASFIIGIIVAIVLAIIGIAVKYLKAYWLISGYNTMSKAKKKNVDIINLGKFIGNISFALSGIILAASLLMSIKQALAAGIIFSLLVPVSIYTIIKSQAYDGNTKNPDGTTKKGTKVLIGAVIGFLVLVMVGVSTLFIFSSKHAEYSIQGEVLKISGLYGEEIRLSEIEEIIIKDQMPEIQTKNNGSALGSIKKGYFKLKDIGQAKLFLNSENPPVIFMDVKSGFLILNTSEPEKTQELYELLLAAWKKE